MSKTVNKISATDARNNFADLVNKVAYSGHEFLITRHDEVMARIVPPEALEEDRVTVSHQSTDQLADRGMESTKVSQTDEKPEEDKSVQDDRQVDEASSLAALQQDPGPQQTEPDKTDQLANQRVKRINFVVEPTESESADRPVRSFAQSRPAGLNSSQQPGSSDQFVQSQHAGPAQTDVQEDRLTDEASQKHEELEPGALSRGLGKQDSPDHESSEERTDQHTPTGEDQRRMSEEERLAKIQRRILKIYRG